MSLTKIKTSNIDTTNQLQLSNVAFVSALSANGSNGTAGQVLTSAGNGNVYWSTASGGGGVSLGLMIALS
jgi:hypothetical protein